MFYIVSEALDLIFETIYDLYTQKEQVPNYKDEPEGIERLLGVLQMVQADEYYSTLLEKAVYLFLQINKGHFFSNGNKRLALVCALFFLAMNNFPLSKMHSKEEHKAKLQKLFPDFYAFEDDERFFPEEYGLYNLSIIVAKSQTYTDGNFDALKNAISDYLDFAIHPVNSGRLKLPW